MKAEDMGLQPGRTNTNIDNMPAIFGTVWEGYTSGDSQRLPEPALQVEVYVAPTTSSLFAITDPMVARRLAMQLLAGAERLDDIRRSRADRQDTTS